MTKKINKKNITKEIDIEISKESDEALGKIVSELPSWIKISAVLVPAIIVVIGLLTLATYNNNNDSAKIIKSTIKEVIDISKVTTIDYTYKTTATKYKSNGKTAKYHVSYEGTIRAGVDLEKIKFEISEKDKKVVIKLPEVEIYETIINTDKDKIHYLFMKEKYETDDIIKEAIKLCEKDLKTKAKNEKQLKEKAKQNAIMYFEGLYKSWIKSIDNEYSVEVK